MKNKFSIKDIEKALKCIKDQGAMDAVLKLDEMGRLLVVLPVDKNGHTIEVIVYHTESAKMPDLTKTERLL